MTLYSQNKSINVSSSFGGLSISENIFILLTKKLLKEIQIGCVTIIFPSGVILSGGKQEDELSAIIYVDNIAAIKGLFSAGAIGFAESYMLGYWNCSDLAKLVEIAALNGELLAAKLAGKPLNRLINYIEHKFHRNSKSGSKNNIHFHYDLGNSFYEKWLDKQMMYSSGIYQKNADTLEDAQNNKIAQIISLLELEDGNEVLEIGCGWGTLSRKIAEKNTKVHGITLSNEQLKYAEDAKKISQSSSRNTLSLTDYRDINGLYDRIVSVEMIEAVGKEYLPVYFQTIRRCLKMDGVAVIQAISIDEKRSRRYNNNPDFIQKYIFPGGFLPTKKMMFEAAENAGLEISYTQYFGESYARTLNAWRVRFNSNWSDIESLGFDLRFKKMWEFYLSYCEGGFRAQSIDVGLYVLKPSLR